MNLRAEETASLAHQLNTHRKRWIIRKLGTGAINSNALALTQKRLLNLKEKNTKKEEKNADHGGTVTKLFLTEEEFDWEISSDMETHMGDRCHAPKKKKRRRRRRSSSSRRRRRRAINSLPLHHSSTQLNSSIKHKIWLHSGRGLKSVPTITVCVIHSPKRPPPLHHYREQHWRV